MKSVKCPNCEERFTGENRQALLKAHVREAHRQEHVSRPDAINVTTPAFHPMTDVLWEKVDRLKARAKRLEEALLAQKRYDGEDDLPCFCEEPPTGDNYTKRGVTEHAPYCLQARTVLASIPDRRHENQPHIA